MNQPTCPGLEQLRAALQPFAPQNADLCEHLTACPNCRAELESLAGAPAWWVDARHTLASPRSEATLRIVSSVCALSDGTPEIGQDAELLEHELEQLRPLLGSACHPELIGSLGRYELEQLVGRGGMGLVFRAFDTELHRIVAVKTLALHLIPIRSARERFVREARASASLVHPHVVPVHDVLTDGAVPAIVMRYIAGPTLESWLTERGPLDWKHALEIACQLASALSAAHEKGLVHRDVKPGNVLLEADGSRALLTDFGLVRALDDATLTRSGILAGTPDFMSPEQARGKPVAPANDLFSLGSVLYAMLTGKPPFHAAGPMATMNKVCHEKHPPIAPELAVPPTVTRLVDRLLMKDSSRRPHSAALVSEQIRRLIVTQHRWPSVFPFYSRLVTSVTILALVFALAVSHLPIWRSGGDTQPLSVTESSGDGGGLGTHSKNSKDDRSVARLDVDAVLDHQYLDKQLLSMQRHLDRIVGELQSRPALSDDHTWDTTQSKIRSLTSSLDELEADLNRGSSFD